MRNQRGITLIALVITIIVLLILAGVSIAMLTGDNGILTKATEATSETDLAEVLERVNMELNAQLTNAMAEDAFDAATTIQNNINNGISGTSYSVAVTVADSGGATTNAAVYNTSNIVKITITAPTGVSITQQGQVAYSGNSWRITEATGQLTTE